MPDVYLICRGRQILYRGGRYGFQLLLNYLENLAGLSFRVIKGDEASRNSPFPLGCGRKEGGF